MNTNLALGVQPLQIPDQAAGYQKALTMAALLGQGDLQKLQIAHATRENTKQAALDDLAKNSTTMDEFLKGYAKLDPLAAQSAAINMRKLTLDTQKTQGEVDTQSRTSDAANANAIIGAAPQDRPTVYAQLRAQEVAKGNQNAINSPEAWNDSMLPMIIAHQQQGMNSKDAMERGDYAAAAPQQPTTMAAYTAQQTVPQDVVDPQSGAIARPMGNRPIDTNRPIINNPDGSISTERTITIEADGKHILIPTIVNGQQLSPDAAISAWRDGKNNEVGVYSSAQEAEQAAALRSKHIGDVRSGSVQPTHEVAAQKTGQSPEDLRIQARAARAKGTKAGSEIAKDLEAEANRVESRALQEQGLVQQKETAAENIRVREEGIKLRQQNQGNNARNQASKLADDFRQEPAVKDYRTVQPLVASMQNAAAKNTAASDLDMVYAIAKIFDPGSVVREGEQIMVVNAGGLPSKMQSAIGFINGGQRLSPTLRSELLDQAKSRADNYKQAYDSASKSYRDQATRWELNPDDIVRDYKVTAKGAMAEGKGPKNPGAGSGSHDDPFKIKGDDGFELVPSGGFFTGPDGKLRQKP